VMSASIKEAASVMGNRRSVWVLDGDGRLLGWVDRASLLEVGSVGDVMVRGDTEEIAVMNNATLREALSRMLGQGFKSLPVVDEGKHLIGEVTLSDVEAATVEAEV